MILERPWDAWRLTRLCWYAETSMLKTLGAP